MNNSGKECRLNTDCNNLQPGDKKKQGNLYVAYRNKVMIDACNSGIENNNSGDRNAGNYKSSVFSTTGGFYYINGIPFSLAQDNEAMLYEEELAEYYYY